MKQNTRRKGFTVSRQPDTTNYEGAPAYLMTPQVELYTRTLGALFGESKFYESADNSTARIIELTRKLSKDDPEFVAGLAIVARQKFHLRTVPQVLIAELAQVHKGNDIVSASIQHTIQRADDMTEMLAYHGKHFGKPGKPLARIPKQVKVGLASAFTKFDAYQLAKYNRDAEVKLRDVLFLCHAKPINKAQARIWEQLIDGSLESPDTWEVNLSTANQHGISKQQAWINSIPNMPYMATLRNIRNFVQNNIDPSLFLSKLTNPELVAKSKQFPYRFYTAYRELQNSGAPVKVMDAVITAMNLSIANLPTIAGKTLVACDNSGSMTSHVSGHSVVTCYDVADLMGAIISKKYPDAEIGVFADNWQPVGLSSHDSIMSNAQRLKNTNVGGSTNGYKVFDWLANNKKVMDRVIVFTDCQLWDSSYTGSSIRQSYDTWCRLIHKKPHVYFIDLTGYGSSPLDPNAPQIHNLAGWSDQVFHYIAAIEEKPDIAIDEIYLAIAEARRNYTK